MVDINAVKNILYNRLYDKFMASPAFMDDAMDLYDYYDKIMMESSSFLLDNGTSVYIIPGDKAYTCSTAWGEKKYARTATELNKISQGLSIPSITDDMITRSSAVQEAYKSFITKISQRKNIYKIKIDQELPASVIENIALMVFAFHNCSGYYVFSTNDGQTSLIVNTASKDPQIVGLKYAAGTPSVRSGGIWLYRNIEFKDVQKASDVYKYMDHSYRATRVPITYWICKPPLNTIIINKLRSPALFSITNRSYLTPYDYTRLETRSKELIDNALETGQCEITNEEKMFVVCGTRGQLFCSSASALEDIGIDMRYMKRQSFNEFIPWRKIDTYQNAEFPKNTAAYLIPCEYKGNIILPDGTAHKLNDPGADHGNGDVIVVEEIDPGNARAFVVNGRVFTDMYASVPEKDTLFAEAFDLSDIVRESPEPVDDLFPDSIKTTSVDRDIAEMSGADITKEKEPVPFVLVENLDAEIQEVTAEHDRIVMEAMLKKLAEKQAHDQKKQKGKGGGYKKRGNNYKKRSGDDHSR